MTTITVSQDESTATLLQEKAEKYGISINEFFRASIEDLPAQPEFDSAMRKVLFKHKELYKRVA